MRLVVSSAVLALWMTKTPSNVVDAFSFQNKRTGISITSMPSSSLFMSTIERPMTAPGSPNSAFGAYGKPPHNDDYSYGPSPGSVDRSLSGNNNNNNNSSRDAPTDSFEAYMQSRNRGNPPSPSDYFGRQPPPPPPSNNFGAPPSSPARNVSSDSISSSNSNSNSYNSNSPSSNFGAPSTPAAPTTPSGNTNSFADFATRGTNSPPPQSNNFGAPSTPTPPTTTTTTNPSGNFGAPASPSSNFGAPSTPTNNNVSPPPPAPGSYEAYMNQRNSSSSSSNLSSNFGAPTSNSDSQSRIASTVAAAADPNSPLPPYMSPASLEDANIRSANLPGSPPEGHPDFRMPSINGLGSNPQQQQQQQQQQQRTAAPTGTTFKDQDTSMRPNIAQPISAPLAHIGTNTAVDIGTPSEELVGRLDQVLHQQREFSDRLDKVDAKIDRTTQENILRTQAMLDNFKEENKKTQETFMNRINSDIRGMRTTMDKVLDEQRDLQQTQKDQTAKFADMERQRAEQSEKLRQLQEQSRGRPVGSNTDDDSNRMADFERAQLERMAAFEEDQRKSLEESLKQYQSANPHRPGSPMTTDTPDYMKNHQQQQQQQQQRNGAPPVDETERLLQQRLNEAQARKEELLAQLRDMQRQEELHNNRGPGSHEDPHMGGRSPPPPPPFASPLDQQMHQYSPQQQQQGSSFGSNNNKSDRPPQGSPPPRFDDYEDGRMRQPRFDDEDDVVDDIEEEPPKRRMMRDRLGKAGGEELYSRGPAANRRRFDEDEDDEDTNDFMDRRMDPEEERRMQHERMMRRDPVDPPEAMGPENRRRPSSPAGRYDPRRGGPFSREEDELAYDISDDRAVHKSLSNMKAFSGDEQMPKKGLFDDNGMGRSMDRRRAPAGGQAGRGMQQPPPPQQRPQQPSGPKERRTGLLDPPPANPVVDQKIEHFLKETLTGGPQPHFDKELESLFMVKYSPLFSWLKPGNMAFLRNVVVTYLQHKGCQVEMDLKSASPKAAREWEELLNILDFELNQRTGEKPRIVEEPNNQWGIYGSKNLRMKISSKNLKTPNEQQRRRGGGLSPEEAARRKRVNDKAFRVSQDPTDPTQRLL